MVGRRIYLIYYCIVQNRELLLPGRQVIPFQFTPSSLSRPNKDLTLLQNRTRLTLPAQSISRTPVSAGSILINNTFSVIYAGWPSASAAHFAYFFTFAATASMSKPSGGSVTL